MSEVWRDSFDHYTDPLQKYTAGTGQIVAGAARTGIAGYRPGPANGAFAYTPRELTAAQEHATLYAGAAIRLNTVGGVIGFAFKSDASTIYHMIVGIDNTGAIVARRGSGNFNSGGTLLGSVGGLIVQGVWYYMEVRCTLSDAAGVVEVRLNGNPTPVLNLTAVDTKNGGTKTAFDTIVIAGDQKAEMDDYYVNNGAGTANNTFNGDTEVITLLPAAAGNQALFTPTTAPNWDAVNEVPPSSADYVSATVDGTRDLYTFTDLSNTTGLVRSVTEHIFAAKVGTETKFVRDAVRSGGTTYEGTSQVLATGYLYQRATRELDPATGVAWTRAGVNSAEWGIVAKDT